MGTACVTPSPESKTTPVTRPVAYLFQWKKHYSIYTSCNIVEYENTYKLKTACIETKRAGALIPSKKNSAAFSRFLRGFKGASVNNTGCSSVHVDNCSWKN